MSVEPRVLPGAKLSAAQDRPALVCPTCGWLYGHEAVVPVHIDINFRRCAGVGEKGITQRERFEASRV